MSENVKTRIPKIDDPLTLQRISYGVVCRNASDPNIYIMQCEYSGIYHLIRHNNSFTSFIHAGDILEYLREAKTPDLWNETGLTFVVSIE